MNVTWETFNGGRRSDDLRELLAEAIINLPPAKVTSLLACMLERMVESNHVTLNEALAWVDAEAVNVDYGSHDDTAVIEPVVRDVPVGSRIFTTSIHGRVYNVIAGNSTSWQMLNDATQIALIGMAVGDEVQIGEFAYKRTH